MIRRLRSFKMQIIIIFTITIIAISLIIRNFIYFAKKNLFKNQSAWSGKDMKIKYTNTRKDSQSKENDNYLKMIADESRIYLDDQSSEKDNTPKKI